MVLYIDVIFFENIILNYIIILSTVIICKEKINHFRIFLSSFIGSVFSICSYLCGSINIIWKVILSIIMVLIVAKRNSIIRILIVFYVISFIIGGLAFALLFMISPKKVILVDNHFLGIYPVKITILAGIFGFVIILIISRIIKEKLPREELLCDLEIFYNARCVKIKAMIDTGNLLKEPISDFDVIIVEKDSLINILPDDILQNINSIISGREIKTNDIYTYKLKIIPFSSLGNENGMLIGFKPDSIKVLVEKEIIRSDVLVAIYDGKLSKENLFTSLIGLNILKD